MCRQCILRGPSLKQIFCWKSRKSTLFTMFNKQGIYVFSLIVLGEQHVEVLRCKCRDTCTRYIPIWPLSPESLGNSLQIFIVRYWKFFKKNLSLKVTKINSKQNQEVSWVLIVCGSFISINIVVELNTSVYWNRRTVSFWKLINETADGFSV